MRTRFDHLRTFRFFVALALSVVLQACASLADMQKPPSSAIPVAPDSRLAALLPTDLRPGEGSAFRPLSFSSFAMDARLSLINRAQHSVDVQYYLLGNDLTGRAFLRAVRDAAVRGVRVRILVDDLYTAANDDLLEGISAYANVEVRLFNPFPAGRALNVTRWGMSLADITRLNHRMHNKMLIVDGVFAIVGGRNIADEYFFRNPRGNFIDFDLLVAGDAVPELARTFDLYWNSRHVYTLDALEPDAPKAAGRRAEFDAVTASASQLFKPVTPTARDLLNYGPLSHDIGNPPLRMLRGKIEVVADSPEKVSGESSTGKDPSTVISHILRSLASAQEDVLMATPYFVPGKLGLAGLSAARARGVPVTLVTNTMAANDEPFVSAAYGHYRRPMLQLGMQIYEVSPRLLKADGSFDDSFGSMLGPSTGRLHAKIVVLDRETTVVGSMNLDLRSSRDNTELGLFVHSPELAADVITLVNELRAAGTYRMRLGGASGRDVEWVDDSAGEQKVFYEEPEISFSTLLQVWLLSPFIREDFL